MVTVRNWRAATPVVAHDNVLRWTIMEQQGTPDFPPEYSPLHTISGVALHMMSPGKEAEGHDHDDVEQLYYFTRGRGKMRLDDQVYPVREGDTAHVPPGVEHQLVNDGDDWLEHLILNAPRRHRRRAARRPQLAGLPTHRRPRERHHLEHFPPPGCPRPPA